MARKRKDRSSETIAICGREIVIEYKRNLVTDDGCLYPDDAEIHVDLTAVREPDQILFHEMIHAALAYSGLVDLLTDEVEEAICSCLEQNLFPHIKLRPREKI
jgi:hypothetical protein